MLESKLITPLETYLTKQTLSKCSESTMEVWNALRERHKYGGSSGNQYAARRCTMITRLTRNSLCTDSSPLWVEPGFVRVL